MRCSRCGNENPDGNRFCGMCGATLLSAPPIAETATQRAASAGTPVSTPVTVVPPLDPPPIEPRPVIASAGEPTRAPAREYDTDDAPIISGPSFLGLSDPNPRKRATLRAESQDSRSSRNLDYLLDEPAEESGGAGKIILIVALLALAAGFGYMTWKNHGIGWLSAILSKPPTTTQAPGTSDNTSPAPASTDAQAPAASQATPSTAQPATTQPSPSPASNQPASQQTVGSNDTAKPANSTPAQPAAAAPGPADSDDAKAATTANPPADADDDTSADDTSADSKEPAAPAAQPEKPRAATPKPAPKPNAAVVPAKPFDPVSEAQKYLYGRGGTAQDCDRGLKLLKPAANAANSKAMIEMGALYSAGLCTPRDLPTAYRWFAIALRKDPENTPVQQDLQKLWGEMTQPERQLAIKLTQ